MQLRLDAADRLVELVQEARGPVPAPVAAQRLFALARPPDGLARSLLDDVVRHDARLQWSGTRIALASAAGDGERLLEAAAFIVVDLETTGLAPGHSSICEIGCVRVRALEPCATFQTLVRPDERLPTAVAALTGLTDVDLRHAPSSRTAVLRFLDFAGDTTLVAHNARFDTAFLDREVERATGLRLSTPVVDTLHLARRLLAGRVARTSLASLSHFFGTSVRPVHRALPDAQATAEILIALIGLAQERGARTVADLQELAAARPRRVHGKRSLAFGAPARPGVYLFRDGSGQVLYVGRARDLRARLRSYFGTTRQRPAVEAALLALDRIEWRLCGSELEAGLEELRLLRELRPPANARGARPDRYLFLARRGDGMIVTSRPGPLGPIRSRRRAELAARALRSARPDELDLLTVGAPLPRLRSRLRTLTESLRYEDAARLHERIRALEHVIRELNSLERLRAAELCLLAPGLREGDVRAYFVAAGRVAAVRTVPRNGSSRLEVQAGLAEARAAACGGPSFAPEAADELLLVDRFVRRPPPELVVTPFEPERILAACAQDSGSAVA